MGNPEQCSNPACKLPRPAGDGWMRLPGHFQGYELMAQAGRGDRTAVYFARGTGNNLVAVKMGTAVGATRSASEALAVRFRREVALRKVVGSHSEVIHVLEQGAAAHGIPYMIMEAVRGDSLEDLLGPVSDGGDPNNPTRRATISPHRTVRLLRRVVGVLGPLHRHRLVHRTLRPSALFLGRAGGSETVKLGELGHALVGGDRSAPVQPGPDNLSVAGTAYLAPEVVQGRASVRACADVYSLGVIAYEMLGGRLPYRVTDELTRRKVRGGLAALTWGSPAPGWLRAHLLADRVPLEEVRPDLPGALCDLVNQCLAREAQDRVQSVGELTMQLALAEQELARASQSAQSGAGEGAWSLGRGEPSIGDQAPAGPSAGPLAASDGPVAVLAGGATAPATSTPSPASEGPGSGLFAMAQERDRLKSEVNRLASEVERLGLALDQAQVDLEAANAEADRLRRENERLQQDGASRTRELAAPAVDLTGPIRVRKTKFLSNDTVRESLVSPSMPESQPAAEAAPPASARNPLSQTQVDGDLADTLDYASGPRQEQSAGPPTPVPAPPADIADPLMRTQLDGDIKGDIVGMFDTSDGAAESSEERRSTARYQPVDVAEPPPPRGRGNSVLEQVLEEYRRAARDDFSVVSQSPTNSAPEHLDDDIVLDNLHNNAVNEVYDEQDRGEPTSLIAEQELFEQLQDEPPPLPTDLDSTTPTAAPPPRSLTGSAPKTLNARLLEKLRNRKNNL